MSHCPCCIGLSGSGVLCPGCPSCAEKDAALAVADEMAELLNDIEVDTVSALVQRYREARRAV